MFSGINVSVWRPFSINTLVQHDRRHSVLISTTSCVCQAVLSISAKDFSPFSYQQCDWLELHPTTPTPSVTSQKDRSPVRLPAVPLFCSFVSLSLCLFTAPLHKHTETLSHSHVLYIFTRRHHTFLCCDIAHQRRSFSARSGERVFTQTWVWNCHMCLITQAAGLDSARDVHYQMAVLVLDLGWHHMLRV